MDDSVNLTGLPTTIATAVGVFFACMAALNKWMQAQKNDVTQVTILTDDRDRWQGCWYDSQQRLCCIRE